MRGGRLRGLSPVPVRRRESLSVKPPSLRSSKNFSPGTPPGKSRRFPRHPKRSWGTTGGESDLAHASQSSPVLKASPERAGKFAPRLTFGQLSYPVLTPSLCCRIPSGGLAGSRDSSSFLFPTSSTLTSIVGAQIGVHTGRVQGVPSLHILTSAADLVSDNNHASHWDEITLGPCTSRLVIYIFTHTY